MLFTLHQVDNLASTCFHTSPVSYILVPSRCLSYPRAFRVALVMCMCAARKRRQYLHVINQCSIQLMGSVSISANYQLQKAQFKFCNILTSIRLDTWMTWILLGGCWRPREMLSNIYIWHELTLFGINCLLWNREFKTGKQRCLNVSVYKCAKCLERRLVLN